MTTKFFEPGPGALGESNLRLHEKNLQARDRVIQARIDHGYHVEKEYAFARLQQRIKELGRGFGFGEISIAFVDRKKFEADLALTIPEKLKSLGAKQYAVDVLPALQQFLEQSAASGELPLASVKAVGIYANVRLQDQHLVALLDNVLALGVSFGETDNCRFDSIFVDYSSPNAAKRLHAGHIRSTIIGEVLCNLYEATGATVHRLNHINDLGGFGFYLEGFRRWEHLLPETDDNNTRLAELYMINRRLERIRAMADWTIGPDEQQLIQKCFGPIENQHAFHLAYDAYKAKSTERYGLLEAGDGDEVTLWKQMVSWSHVDFDQFYQLLDAHHDYTIGESFYAHTGMNALKQNLATGKLLQFSETDARLAVKRVEAQALNEELSEKELEHAREGILNDIGALVVPLSNERRLVCLRSDGRTIYATRDLGAICYRTEFFKPTRTVYVVGQEQQTHFADLFEAARLLDVDGGSTFEHVYFGFYVDSQTKKKLSSRDGASNVQKLLEGAVKYFRNKFADNTTFSDEEKDTVAHQLALGSVVFHDLKKGRKTNVEIPSNPDNIFEEFEKSGGAYVMYAACRCTSILRKFGAAVPSVANLEQVSIRPLEAELIKRIIDFPDRVQQAARTDDPSVLFGHLLETARTFSSYYAETQVLKEATEHPYRIALVAAIDLMLRNGLRLGHISCPDRI